MQRRAAAFVATVVICVLALPLRGALTFDDPVLDRTIYPRKLAAAADRVWFTDERFTPHSVGFFTLDTKKVTTFPVPCDGCDNATNITYLEDIAVGADGNAWFVYTEVRSDGAPLNGGDNNYVGRMTPSGQFTRFRVPTKDAFRRYFFPANYSSIARGPGGMWFTENAADKIGRIAYDGTVSEFPLSTFSGATDITEGPDGNAWFTLTSRGQVGRITPAGVITTFTLPGQQPPTTLLAPFGIVAADGALWVSERTKKQLVRIDSSGNITQQLQLTEGNASFGAAFPGTVTTSDIRSDADGDLTPLALFADPDGKIAQLEKNRLTLAFAVRFFPPSRPVSPRDVAITQRGATLADVWFAAVDSNFEDVLGHAAAETPPAPVCPPGTDLKVELLNSQMVSGFEKFDVPTVLGVKGVALPTSGFSASGGTAPYQFQVTSGTLPPGVQLSSAGQITGVPQATATTSYPITVTVTDANHCTKAQAFLIRVYDSCNGYLVIYPYSEDGLIFLTLGAIRLVLAHTGAPPVTLTASGLPAGIQARVDGRFIRFEGSTAATVTLGSYPFKLTVRDANQCSATLDATFIFQKNVRRRTTRS